LQASFTPVFLLTAAPIINKIPYLQRPIAFEARDFFLMLFCSSIGRWGMLCLPSTSNSFWCLLNFNSSGLWNRFLQNQYVLINSQVCVCSRHSRPQLPQVWIGAAAPQEPRQLIR
jgi:hypothetical protein